ncbi:acyl-CoA dehydrogenase family protein [Rhizorhabdus dicambivorans]|uniref:Acyl-CoA dehydrogenase n=1 Tax=Rhizorhabdus dicambivorans TaxID=1850238 RepID=A0A2A4FXL6_9SPHN|nr:acyl-CoA dehydrogenase family protein [Rhizorhabdus dicambivorans]ATE63320.1 hypothetical protein CMV14_01990 [Rhizorhabdus dicambivorans]PCE43534.1 hypothetical protein COO09_04310 [Rhizorhabdus dicambivorans]
MNDASDTLPGLDEAVRAARAMAPRLAARARETEALRRMPEETLAEFRAAGFYRMCAPVAKGGWGLDVETAIRVSFELSQGCASSGWAAAQIGFEAIMVQGFPQAAQDEYWAPGPDVGAVSGNALLGGTVEPVEGGLRIRDGRWKFASGADQADWLILTQPMRGGTDMVLVPRADFAIEDDWHVIGLKGTGSKQVTIADAFVPAHRIAPLSRIRSHAMSIWILGAIAWGAALGAHRDFVSILRERRSSKDLTRPAQRDGVQLALARSGVELDCCAMLFERNLALFRKAEGEGRELSAEEGLIVARDCSYVCELAYRGTQSLFDEYGSSVIYDDVPIQRALRDIMAATRHGRVAWHLNGKKYGMWRLGLLSDLPPPADPA